VETGRQRVPRNFWERTDATLRTGGTLATGHDELQAAQRNELRAAAHQVSTARQAHNWQVNLNPTYGTPAGRPAADDAALLHPLQEPWQPDEHLLSVDSEPMLGLADGNDTAGPPLAIRPLTCTYFVAGVGFEPATSGL
jgi:hypothetical protein